MSRYRIGLRYNDKIELPEDEFDESESLMKTLRTVFEFKKRLHLELENQEQYFQHQKAENIYENTSQIYIYGHKEYLPGLGNEEIINYFHKAVKAGKVHFTYNFTISDHLTGFVKTIICLSIIEYSETEEGEKIDSSQL